MLYTIKNNELCVTVSDNGAELISVKRGDCEYIWVAEGENYWKSKAPIPFPVCGRFFEGKYTAKGKTYELPCHGFLRSSVTKLAEQTENSLTFELAADDETKKVYPYEFLLRVHYILDGSSLETKIEIINTGDEILPATAGGHPGYNVPLDGCGSFEDYYVEFSEDCSPDEIVFSDTCFLTGKKRAYPIENSRIIRLHHGLFDRDAIFMSRAASSVTLKSDKTDRYVKMTYTDMPYVGLWHTPKTDAPFVCIEPWCGLPAYDGVVEDIETKHDMFRIEPGHKKTVGYTTVFD